MTSGIANRGSCHYHSKFSAGFAKLNRETNYFGQKLFFPLTYVADCKQQLTTSTANLSGTEFKFSTAGGGLTVAFIFNFQSVAYKSRLIEQLN